MVLVDNGEEKRCCSDDGGDCLETRRGDGALRGRRRGDRARMKEKIKMAHEEGPPLPLKKPMKIKK